MDRNLFFVHVRETVFGGHMTPGQASGLGAILDYKDKNFAKMADPDFAYALATTTWETARTMQPIAEIGHGRGRAYGHPTGPWHQIYYGRGDVQETWERNYKFATQRLRALGLLKADEDLEKTPDLAMRPDIAAAILFVGMTEGWFTGKKLDSYIHGTVCDFTNCRRIINGTDHAPAIAAIARSYQHALETAADKKAA